MPALTAAEMHERDRHPLVIAATRANAACVKAFHQNPRDRTAISNAVRAQRGLAETFALVRAELLAKRSA